jgi:predicted nucleotidyltransferase
VIIDESRQSAAVAALRKAIPSLAAVYQFGSSVTGVEHLESDVDLAFLATAPPSHVDRFDLQQELASVLKREVDLIDLRSASTVMAIQVISTGRLLYDADASVRGGFEDFTYSSYARLNEERREILTRVRVEGTVYGR